MKIKSFSVILKYGALLGLIAVLFQNCNSSSGFSVSPRTDENSPNSGDRSGDSTTTTPNTGLAISLIAGGVSGIGNLDGSLGEAKYHLPVSAVFDSKGNAFVISFEDPTIRKISTNGDVSVFAGQPSTVGNTVGEGKDAQLGKLTAIAIDAYDNLFVTDSTFCLIKKITPAGVVSIVAGFLDSCGYVDGQISTAKFSNSLSGIALDSSRNIYVSERNSHTIRKIFIDGTVTTFAGSPNNSGNTNGVSTEARFQYPENLTFDFEGNLYVSDSGNREIRKITQTGSVSKFAGLVNSSLTTGNLSGVRVGQVQSMVWKNSTEFYYSSGGAIYKVSNGNYVTLFCGNESAYGLQNGSASSTLFGGTFRISYNQLADSFVVLDTHNHSLRKVDSNGESSQISGQPHLDGSTDGPSTQARFGSIASMSENSSGEIYLLDKNGYSLRVIAKDGTVSTLPSHSDLEGAESIVFDSDDNLYISNPSKHIILKRTSLGALSIYAGQKNTSGFQDGSTGSALFWTPMGLAVDKENNLYVADRNNGRIRKIFTDGRVVTFASSVKIANSNDTLLELPTNIGIGPDQSLFFTEASKHWIGKVTINGEVSFMAGNQYESGLSNGSLVSARFNSPTNLSIGPDGAIYVVDLNNRLIRKIKDNSVSTYAGIAGYYGAKLDYLPTSIGFVTNLLFKSDRLIFSDGVAVFQIK